MLNKTIAAAAMAAVLGPVALAQETTSTIVGCVYQEKDVPGRAPNVAERAGILEDYILAEITPAEAAKPAAGAGAPPTSSMYKLEKVADSKLKEMVGKRVEVTGKVDAEADDVAGRPPASAETNKTDRAIGRDRVNLPEFEVASIRSVAGSCPAKPTTDR
jgi:hypothetical protein